MGKKAHCGLTQLPGIIFFFKSSFLQCSCVHKKWGLTHRPQCWPTTSGRRSVGSETVRNRGATPKCHHSCKTAEHKSQITEICNPRPPDNENRASFEWPLPAERSVSCPVLYFVGFTMSKKRRIPQLPADVRELVFVVESEFYGLPIIVLRYCSSSLMPNDVVFMLHEGGPGLAT